MQVCHGKSGPLRRIKPGDRVVYYSPTLIMGGKDKLQAFTALGIVKVGEPYQFDAGGEFYPFRRDVEWLDVNQTPIQPLLQLLEFSAGKQHWGYQLRFGVFQSSDHDIKIIAHAMGASFRLA